MQKAEEGAGRSGDEQALVEVSALEHGQPAAHSAQRHDALDAEVEDTGPFADQLAQRSEDEWRRDAQHCRPETRGQQNLNGPHRRRKR
jgi:hypothetical protein